MPPRATAKGAPRPAQTKPKPPPQRRPGNTATAGTGLGLIGAGAQLGTAFIGARALNDTLDKLTENPMLLAAVAGIALVFLIR
jgi:hypothetical protein